MLTSFRGTLQEIHICIISYEKNLTHVERYFDPDYVCSGKESKLSFWISMVRTVSEGRMNYPCVDSQRLQKYVPPFQAAIQCGRFYLD